MSDGYFEDEYDDQPDYEQAPPSNGPKALRDAYEREKEARKALEERLAKLEEQDRKAKLADRLKNAGVKNPQALGKWASKIEPDEADEFWAAVRAASGEAQPTEPALSDEDAAALAAVSGEPSGTAPVTTGDSAANIAAIDNEADFWKAIRG